MSTVFDLVGDLLDTREASRETKDRPLSPRGRPLENGAKAGESPLSPLSPDRGPRLDDLDPEGRAAGERIYHGLSQPRSGASGPTSSVRPAVGTLPRPERTATPERASRARSWGWRLHYPDREPAAIYVSPKPTLEEVLAEHPEAIAAEPLPEPERLARPLPAELDGLIRRVATHHGFTAAELQEALDVAGLDIDGALLSFRALAAEISGER